MSGEPHLDPDPAREAGEKAFDVVWNLLTQEMVPDLARRFDDNVGGNLLLNVATNCISWLIRVGVEPSLLAEHLDKALQAGLEARDADGATRQ